MERICKVTAAAPQNNTFLKMGKLQLACAANGIFYPFVTHKYEYADRFPP